MARFTQDCDILGLILILALLIALYTTKWGIGLVPDSVSYIQGARGIIEKFPGTIDVVSKIKGDKPYGLREEHDIFYLKKVDSNAITTESGTTFTIRLFIAHTSPTSPADSAREGVGWMSPMVIEPINNAVNTINRMREERMEYLGTLDDV